MSKKRGKNILLVYPRLPKNTYWSFSHSLKFIGKKSAMPPLGLVTVAAMLPENYNLKLVDMNVQKLEDKDINWADAVFISSMIIQNESIKEVISKAKEFGKTIVAGGPYPTQYYEQIKGVDHFIIGEAESGVLKSFLRDFEKGQAKKAYARISIRKRGKGKEIDQEEYEALTAFFGKDADIELIESRPCMSLSPVPRFDLLDIDKYYSMAVQMSRGCPFNCEFCNEGTLFGDMSRLKPSDKFVEELEAIYNLGHRGAVFVVDDNFIGNIKQAKDVLKKIIEFQKEKNHPLSLYTEASINLAWDDELMGLMRDAGFNMAFIGFESPDKEVLKSMNKFQNLQMDPIEAVRKIQSYGIEVTGGFIVGNDNEPEDIHDKLFDFCQEAGIPRAMVGLLTAVKGSELYERLKQEGRLAEDPTEGNNTHSFELNFKPLPGQDEKKMIENYKNLLAKLYDRKGKNYFARCTTLMKNLGSHPKSTRDIGLKEIRALGLSLISQSLFVKYSRSYRRFVLEALENHTKLVPEAVANAILGRHLIKITHTSLKADSLQKQFAEKLEYFKTQMNEAWETKKAESAELCSRLIYEKDVFLAKAKAKIEKFPPDYRPKLTKAYKQMALSLNCLL